MIQITDCPICKSTDLQNFRSCEDFTVSHEMFHVKRCSNCTLGITTPRPDNNKLGDYYRSNEYISHSGKSSGGIGIIYRIVRSFALYDKLSKIQKFKRSGSILDFGCGTGEFLKTMKNAKWNIQGLEVSHPARQKAEKLTGKKIIQSLDEISSSQFDVITAWHVIEHVPDLTQTIQKLKMALKKDGVLFIAVPNYVSPDAEKYQNFWAGFDVPRHLWHFSKQSMATLFESASLKLLDIVPMKLDAYYVSMLSEKYQNKNVLTPLQIVSGFFSGLTSNLRAGKNNHSSLIYIAKINEG